MGLLIRFLESPDEVIEAGQGFEEECAWDRFDKIVLDGIAADDEERAAVAGAPLFCERCWRRRPSAGLGERDQNCAESGFGCELEKRLRGVVMSQSGRHAMRRAMEIR